MQSINGFHIDEEFSSFINRELFADGRSKADFWNQFTTILQRVHPITEHTGDTEEHGVSLLTPRYALKAINTRWGSLYSALYHENAIPHSAGLKTGQRFNVARASRVVDYARSFLDSAFPLMEGSHRDAVSYMVYYQNLMVTLADGSTTGLQEPAHFAAKSGAKESPDAIVLRNDDVHVEILFDGNGVNGAADMANIDDIKVEAPGITVLSCDAKSVEEQCDVLRHLKALIDGSLKASFQRDGRTRTRRLNRSTEFTARDGSTYLAEGRNPVAVQLNSSSICHAVRDSQGHPVSSAVVNAILFTAISDNRTQGEIAMMASNNETFELVQTVIGLLQQDKKDAQIKLIKNYGANATVDANVARTHARQLPCVSIAEKELKDKATIAKQNTAVLNAIQQARAPH